MSESFGGLPPLPATPNLDVDASMQLSPTTLSSLGFDLGDVNIGTCTVRGAVSFLVVMRMHRVPWTSSGLSVCNMVPEPI